MPNRTSRAHINELPLEVLWDIFQSCTDLTSGDNQPPGSGITFESVQVTSPVILSHVSRHWRSAALGLGSLWSFIRVTDVTPLEKTSEWLHRSRDCSLDIVVLQRNRQPAKDVYELLLVHVGRWRELHASVHPQVFSLPFWNLLLRDGPEMGISETRTPRLKVCEIENQLFDSNPLQEHFDKKYLQITSPILTALISKGMRLAFDQLPISHPRITYLDLGLNDKEKCSATLWQSISQMTSLQHLGLDLSDVCEHVEPSPALEYSMPELLTFRIRTPRPCPTLWKWMACLDAPKLWAFHVLQQGICSHPSRPFLRSLHASLVSSQPSVIPLPSLAEFSWMPDWDRPCQYCLESLVPKFIHATTVTTDIRSFNALFPCDTKYPRLEEVFVRSRYRDLWEIEQRPGILYIIAEVNPKAIVRFE
ncbi:hypothetical protein FRC03_005032 [Tulasnella sp. 419]|nr:hypothetical protein FRC03_005032 [Tulasnella sp. 419]